MIWDEGPYIEMDGPGVWVPRTVPYREARRVAATVNVESWQRLVYLGKRDADLLGFAVDCQCEEACERRWRENDLGDYEDTGDRTCHIPSWAFTIRDPCRAATPSGSADLDAELLARALQANQDRTYLDEDNHRHHCGGTCVAAIAAEYNRLRASDQGAGKKP